MRFVGIYIFRFRPRFSRLFIWDYRVWGELNEPLLTENTHVSSEYVVMIAVYEKIYENEVFIYYIIFLYLENPQKKVVFVELLRSCYLIFHK